MHIGRPAAAVQVCRRLVGPIYWGQSADAAMLAECPRGSGRCHSQQPTISMKPQAKADIQTLGAVAMTMAAQTNMVSKDQRLACRLTAPCSCQLRIIGPNNECASNQVCNRGDPLAAQAAANSTNGVVGRPGSSTPSTARTTNSPASAIQVDRTSLFTTVSAPARARTCSELSSEFDCGLSTFT